VVKAAVGIKAQQTIIAGSKLGVDLSSDNTLQSR
jgi:hypothetical protein